MYCLYLGHFNASFKQKEEKNNFCVKNDISFTKIVCLFGKCEIA